MEHRQGSFRRFIRGPFRDSKKSIDKELKDKESKESKDNKKNNANATSSTATTSTATSSSVAESIESVKSSATDGKSKSSAYRLFRTVCDIICISNAFSYVFIRGFSFNAIRSFLIRCAFEVGGSLFWRRSFFVFVISVVLLVESTEPHRKMRFFFVTALGTKNHT